VRYSVGIYSHKTIKLISLEWAVQRLNKTHTKRVINYSARSKFVFSVISYRY